MKVNLKDIAAELNLSVSTVSRVVNGKDRVSPETRSMILAALEAANFKPNEVARSLRLRTAKTIIIIVPDIANNYYASIIKGAQNTCRANGYSVMVCNTDENEQLENEQLSEIHSHQPAGIILASVISTAAQVRKLRQSRLPVVYVDNIPPATDSYNSVSINNVGAAYKLTGRILERGYKRVGIITGKLTQSSGSERLKGYRLALMDAGIPMDESLIYNGDFKYETGYEGMKNLLLNRASLDAVIVCNNFMACGAIRAIRDAGLSIPKDIAIAAFDMVDESNLIQPQIMSINQPAKEIGDKAAEILINTLSQRNDGVYTNLFLDPVFQQGESY